jgi:hypothetical protein
MNDVLLIVGPADPEAELLDELERRRPRRVTVLVRSAEEDWALDRSGAVRDRLAAVLAEVERRTGAAVVGLAGDEHQLRGRRFDGVVEAAPLAADAPLAA